jgi:hypothetical protein
MMNTIHILNAYESHWHSPYPPYTSAKAGIVTEGKYEKKEKIGGYDIEHKFDFLYVAQVSATPANGVRFTYEARAEKGHVLKGRLFRIHTEKIHIPRILWYGIPGRPAQYFEALKTYQTPQTGTWQEAGIKGKYVAKKYNPQEEVSISFNFDAMIAAQLKPVDGLNVQIYGAAAKMEGTLAPVLVGELLETFELE